MISEDLKKLSTEPRDLRKFGLTVGGVFALLALWFWFRGKPAFVWFLVPSVPLLLLGLIAPKSLRTVYLAWMAAALFLGVIVSTVLLTLFFYLIVTPMGWAARLSGNDFLSQRLDPKTPSYWLPRDGAAKKKVDYERQF